MMNTSAVGHWTALPLFLLAVSLLAPCVAGAAEMTRSHFCSGIAEREPADTLEKVPSGLARVFFFTEVRGASGETVTHRWAHNGILLAEVVLPVGGSPWRTWSSKKVGHLEDGTLSVEVIDQDGKLLSESRLPMAGSDKYH